MIRKYIDGDLAFVQEHNLFVSLSIQYNNNVDKNNIFTMVGKADEILGVLVLEYHFTWYSQVEELNRVSMNVITRGDDKETRGALIEYAKTWCEIQRREHHNTKICLAEWIQDSEYDRIGEYLYHEFIENSVCACLKFDLTKRIPEFTLPDKMHIEILEPNEEAVRNYIEATALANEGTSDSIDELLFMSGSPTFKVFVVKDGEIIVSAASVWEITEGRTAVENICTIPAYRRRNLARAVITHALKTQKKQGYKIGTLTVKGKNYQAIKLYLSLGFELYFNQIEMIY